MIDEHRLLVFMVPVGTTSQGADMVADALRDFRLK